MADIDTYKFVSMPRGYHQYQSIWSAVVGEELPCRIKLSNPHDLFAVAICKSDIVVGHVPKRISSICSSFLRQGGSITCKVTGPRRFSADLLQGGLEIPCKLIFTGIPKDIEKVTRLLRLTEGEKNTVRFQIVNKSPSTVIKAVESSGASIAVTDSPKTTLEIDHSSSLSVKVAESPSTSILISDSSHRDVEGSDLELLTCDDPSVAPFSESKPTGTISPKLHTAIVEECVNTQQNVGASSSTTDATDDVQLIGSHCKQSSNKPESQRKKIRRTMPNDEELDRISRGDKLTD